MESRQLKKSPLIVSVVRDFSMYCKCISENPVCDDCEKWFFDNRIDSKHIPVWYNRALSVVDESTSRWLVFCHEDFMPKESIVACLEHADENKLYGVIGGVLLPRKRWLLGGVWGGEFRGKIVESEKDGSSPLIRGLDVPLGTTVDTVDCQCLIVHSSLVVKYGLRFDEELSFDLYAEDFCLGSFLKHGIVTAILPLKCQHFSRGRLLPRFFDQKSYLDRKYPEAEVQGCVGYTIGGGRTVMRRFQKVMRSYLDRHMPIVVKWCFALIRYVHL